MKKILFLFLSLGLMSCFEERPTLSDLTVSSFEKRHKENLEILYVICPTEEIECLQKYKLTYRIWENKRYLYEIKYK
jgi:hypothetical protein